MVKNHAITRLINYINQDLERIQEKIKPMGILGNPSKYSLKDFKKGLKLLDKAHLSFEEITELANLYMILSSLRSILDHLEKSDMSWEHINTILQIATIYGFEKEAYGSLFISLVSYKKNNQGSWEFTELFGHDGKIKKTTCLNPLVILTISAPISSRAYAYVIESAEKMLLSFQKGKKKQYDLLCMKLLFIKDLNEWNKLLRLYVSKLSQEQIQKSYEERTNQKWYELYQELGERVAKGIQSYDDFVRVRELVVGYTEFILRYQDGYIKPDEIGFFCKYIEELRTSTQGQEMMAEEQVKTVFLTMLEGLSMNKTEEQSLWPYYSIFLKNGEVLLPNTQNSEKAFMILSSACKIPSTLQQFLLTSKKISSHKPSIQELFSIFQLYLSVDIKRLESNKDSGIQKDDLERPNLLEKIKQLYQALEKNSFLNNVEQYQLFYDLCSVYDFSMEEIAQMTISILHACPFAIAENEEFEKSAEALFLKNGTIGKTSNLLIVPILIYDIKVPSEIKEGIISQIISMIEKSPMKDKSIRCVGIKLLDEIFRNEQQVVRSQRNVQENPLMHELAKAYYGEGNSIATLEDMREAISDFHTLLFSVITGEKASISYQIVPFALDYICLKVGMDIAKKVAIYLLNQMMITMLSNTPNEKLHRFAQELLQIQNQKPIYDRNALEEGLEALGISRYFDQETLLSLYSETQSSEETKAQQKVAYYYDGKKFIRPVTNVEELKSNLLILYSQEEVEEILAKLSVEEKEDRNPLFDVFTKEEQEFLNCVGKILHAKEKDLLQKSETYQSMIGNLIKGLHTDESAREMLLASETYQREVDFIYIADLRYLMNEIITRAQLLLECEDEELRSESKQIMHTMESCIEGLQAKTKEKSENKLVLLDDVSSPCHVLSDIHVKDRQEKKDIMAIFQKLESGLFTADHAHSFKDLTYFSKSFGGKRAYYIKGPHETVLIFCIILEKNAKKQNVIDQATYGYLTALLQKLYADDTAFANMIVEQMEVQAKAQELLQNEEPVLVKNIEG